MARKVLRENHVRPPQRPNSFVPLRLLYIYPLAVVYSMNILRINDDVTNHHDINKHSALLKMIPVAVTTHSSSGCDYCREVIAQRRSQIGPRTHGCTRCVYAAARHGR